MRVAIMQPYFLPYIGYFQLIGAVDLFVVYDQIKYTKKGWINRNRMLLNGADATFSLPLRKAADSLDIVDRQLAADFNRTKLLAQFYGAYRTAPYFDQTYPLLDALVKHDDDRSEEHTSELQSPTTLFPYTTLFRSQSCWLSFTAPIVPRPILTKLIHCSMPW